MIFRRIAVDKTNNVWMVASLATILALPLIIGIGLYIKSIPLLEYQSAGSLVTSSEWLPSQGKFGFWPFIYGSLYVTMISFLLSAPVCVFAAIYLTQYASKRIVNIFMPIVDILAGLPSVIYGVFGILVVVPFISKYLAPIFDVSTSGYCILAGGIVLSIMSIPYMLNIMIEVFNTVPIGIKEASLSLGATSWESIKHVVVKRSIPGVISAFGLGIAKAFGETIAVMMVVGNVLKISHNPFKGGYPLPALIANNYGEMLSIPKYDSALMFAALLLLVVILLINIVFRYLIYKTQIK